MALPVVKVTCSNTGTTVDADVIHKTQRNIKVALGTGNSSFTLILSKEQPNSKYYVGNKFGMEFTTTGKEI